MQTIILNTFMGVFTSKNSLYLVLSSEYCNKPALEVASEAIAAGVDILQMREKAKSKEKLLELGLQLRSLCQDIPFIVNDDPHLAKVLDADGVHLGQEDFAKYPNARKLVGDKIIGLSTHSLEQVKAANKLDVDYIAFGPIFKTKTKSYSIGVEYIEQTLRISTKPIVFIGGIDESNVNQIVELGAKNVAVIRAITQSENIASSVKKLKNKINSNIVLNINGRRETVKSRTLFELLSEKNYNPSSVIVEYNKEVAKPEEWEAINLADNDNLEIVGIFSGG